MLNICGRPTRTAQQQMQIEKKTYTYKSRPKKVALRFYLLHSMAQILQIRIGLFQVWVFVLVGLDPLVGGLDGRLHQQDALGSVCDVDSVNDRPGNERVILEDLLKGGAHQV